MSGRFLKSESLDGTFVQDLSADEDVKVTYGNDGRLPRTRNSAVLAQWKVVH